MSALKLFNQANNRGEVVTNVYLGVVVFGAARISNHVHQESATPWQDSCHAIPNYGMSSACEHQK